MHTEYEPCHKEVYNLLSEFFNSSSFLWIATASPRLFSVSNFFYQKSYLLHESWQQLVTPMFSFCPDFRSPRDPISCHLSSGRKHNLARPMPASAFAGVNTLLLKSKISKTFFPGLPPLPSYHCQLRNIEETRKLLSGCVALVALGNYWLNICKRAKWAQSNDLKLQWLVKVPLGSPIWARQHCPVSICLYLDWVWQIICHKY